MIFFSANAGPLIHAANFDFDIFLQNMTKFSDKTRLFRNSLSRPFLQQQHNKNLENLALKFQTIDRQPNARKLVGLCVNSKWTSKRNCFERRPNFCNLTQLP
jgi:nicotinamide riboside kinase